MNLEEKFTALELQLNTQHGEIIAALDTIAFALGAPPPAPTITLATISLQLTALNNNLIGIAIANGTFHSALLSLIGQVNTNTDLMLTNNSLNAQRIIAALYATFCECNTDIPLLAPPIDVTPTVIVDEAKCRRIQFYLSVFGNWLNKIANYGASGAAITGGTLAYLLSVAAADAGIIATGVEVGAVGGIPGVVVGAVVGLIVVAVYTFGGSVLIDYANQFSDPTLQDNLLMALYNENNAEDGYIAFKNTLIAGMDNIAAEVIYSLWWTAWSNDIYSGSPVVDDSAFDGTICAPPDISDCVTVQLPSDEGCSTYDYGGATYGRITIAGLAFLSRFTEETTLTSTAPVWASSGGLGASWSGSEITWIGLRDLVGTYPALLDSSPANTTFSVEFCNLAPLP